jgi:putative oxidoreductase
MAILSNRAAANRDNGADAALLILRLVLGFLILAHGISKLPPPPPDYLGGMLAKANLPTALAWGAYVGEIVAPILLIIGVWTRLAAVVIVINMAFAVLLAHTGELFSIDKETGGYALELQAMYLFTAVALAVAGAGRFSVGGRYGPLN